MSVKDSKEPLAPYSSKWDDDGMSIFHKPPRPFVVCYGASEGQLRRQGGIIGGGGYMSIVKYNIPC